MSEKSFNIIIYRTIKYLNSVTNSKYELTKYAFNEDMCKLIDKGYKYEDFKKVIDKKWKQWKGTKFSQYVRPSTLFSQKFETYLNEQSDSESKITKLFESVEQAKRTDWKLD